MSDVSFLRFLNVVSPSVGTEILLLKHDLGLEEGDSFSFSSVCPRVSGFECVGSFEADRALEARHNTPIFRPHYKPDLSAFEPFYQQLSLFPNG